MNQQIQQQKQQQQTNDEDDDILSNVFSNTSFIVDPDSNFKKEENTRLKQYKSINSNQHEKRIQYFLDRQKEKRRSLLSHVRQLITLPTNDTSIEINTNTNTTTNSNNNINNNDDVSMNEDENIYDNSNNNNSKNNEELYSQKLNFLFNILYKFINDNNSNNLSKLIIEFQNRKFKKHNNNIDLEIHETIWNLIIKSICLIPDKCRSIQYYYKNNRIRNIQSPLSSVKDYILEFFTNNNLFYSKIIQQCIQSVNSSISTNLNNNSDNNNNINNIITLFSNQYSILFSKMIKIGEKDIIVNNFFKELFQDDNKNSSLILKKKLSSNIIIGIQGSCLDTFLETIIKSLSKCM